MLRRKGYALTRPARGQKRTFWALSSLLYPRKRTFGGVSGMSAMGQKRTILCQWQRVVTDVIFLSWTAGLFVISPAGPFAFLRAKWGGFVSLFQCLCCCRFLSRLVYMSRQ